MRAAHVGERPVKIAAINFPPPPRSPGGECQDPPRAGRATFADIRDRIDLEQQQAARRHLYAGDGEARTARWWRPTEADPGGAAQEIQLPRDAFTATIVDDAPVAALGDRPASLAPPAPGTPAAAYARAAELLRPDLAPGLFFSTVA